MPQAAYCSECGANVFVTSDGRCPNGHSPESLSDYYDAPAAVEAPAPAYTGPPTAAAPSRAPRSSAKAARIILLVVAIVLLSILGCCVFGGSLLLSDTGTESSGETEPAGVAAEDPEQAAYLEAVHGIESDVYDAVELLEEVYPAQTDEDAEAAATVVDAFDDSYNDVLQLEPHPKYQAIHDHLTEGTRLFTEFGALMVATDFHQLEGAEATQAAELMFEAADQFQKMSDAVDALELVW